MTGMPPQAFIPLVEESVRFETSKHRLIEGDNLPVMRQLVQTMAGTVKLVYIDPPYNTGSTFTYEDKRGDAWVEMMRPRLQLAHDLIRNDGAIVVHIDEHELARLTLLLDEIFGREHRLGTIVWDKKNPKGDATGIAIQHETIVCYARNRKAFHTLERAKPNVETMITKATGIMKTLGQVRLPPDLAETATRYRLPEPALAPHRRPQTLADINKTFNYWLKKQLLFQPGERAYSKIDEQGRVFQAVSMAWPNKKKAPDSYFIPLLHPTTQQPCPIPARGWRNPPRTMERLLAEERVVFGTDESTQPRRKYFLDEVRTEGVPSILRDGSSDDKRLAKLGVPFDHAKPLSVAQRIVRWFTNQPNDLVLDFFAGSGTTGHAVLAENRERNKGLRFLLIQKAEPVKDKTAAKRAGFVTVSEMTRKRLQQAIMLMDKDALPGPNEDRGFKAERLEPCDGN
jgi:adenine-specific DNA-methyltransferase